MQRQRVLRRHAHYIQPGGERLGFAGHGHLLHDDWDNRGSSAVALDDRLNLLHLVGREVAGQASEQRSGRNRLRQVPARALVRGRDESDFVG